MFRCIIVSCLFFIGGLSVQAEPLHSNKAIKKGLRYLASVQLEYGEFPTNFYPNKPAPNDVLYASYDSNIFTSAMIADAIHIIPHPWVKKMNRAVSEYLLRQLNSEQGLWSYFTTHNPAPLYPNTLYDLDDTAFASMVLAQNGYEYPDNLAAIEANKNQQGTYLTFVGRPEEDNDVDCGVNANVLSYLQTEDPQICQYLNTAVASGGNCANYYSQLDAYYLISRAYHSGVTCLSPSLESIKRYVLDKIGSNGSVDDNAFETAIAANALMDLDYRGPELQSAMRYLLGQQSKITGAWPTAAFWLWGTPPLGRSGSAAMTTAIALKALYRWKH